MFVFVFSKENHLDNDMMTHPHIVRLLLGSRQHIPQINNESESDRGLIAVCKMVDFIRLIDLETFRLKLTLSAGHLSRNTRNAQ